MISPLLANIALHGMEQALGVKKDYRGWTPKNSVRAVVRYADDFVVCCESKADAEQVVETLRLWLKERGLALSQEKTRIVHLTEGFDFLGFTIRHYKVTNTRTGYKLLITPSKQSVAALRKKIKEVWLRKKGQHAPAIIAELNPLIRGWANYFRRGVANRTFRALDHWMVQREKRYARRLHPNKPWRWIVNRYWGKLHPHRNEHWVFGSNRPLLYLQRFSWFDIQRHPLVTGDAAPDDPKLRAYWHARDAAKAADHIASHRKLASVQKGVCPTCGESLFNGEALHVHHVVPRKDGGANAYTNLRLVHFYCHQQEHA